MSNDFVNNKAPEQQDSLSYHVSKVFEKSSLCAVSTILSTENKPRRITRSVVFGLFTVAFLYQCIVSLHYVLQFPTIVDHEIIRAESFVSPAYTFCNNNVLKRSKFCDKYPSNCTRPNREFCFENPRFCGTPDTQIVKSDIFDANNLWKLYEFSHDAVEMLDFDDESEDKPFGPLPRANMNDEHVAACFSIFGRVNSPLDPFMIRKTPSATGDKQVFIFDPQENELVYPEATSGIMFDIHSPFDPSNPFETGTLLRPGYLYRIRVKLSQEELLPNDCTNYTEVWLKNDKSGYRSRATCRQKCMGDLVVKCFNCSYPFVLYPYPNVTMCSPDPPKLNRGCENMEELISECVNECKDDCLKLRYSFEVQENFRNKYAHKAERNESRKIKVIIQFPDMDIQKIVHKPQFLVFEVFSLLGGLLAFWIGFSMFQFFEVFDCMFQIAREGFKRRSSRSEGSSA